VAIEGYTLEQAEAEIAELRGLIDVLTEAHVKGDATDAPDVPAAGLISYSSGGHEKYTSADGTAYNTGRLTLSMPSGLHITSTSDSLLTGMSCAVAAGSYRFSGVIFFTMGTTNAGAVIACSPHGPTASVYITGIYYFANLGGSISSRTATVLGTGPSSNASIAVNAAAHAVFHGFATFTASGTFSIQAAEATSGVDFTAQAGSYCDLMPVT
jgi:hypothetical protein